MYDVCLRTGASGEDASELYAHPELLGHVYVGPYLRFAQEFAFVVEDGAGVGGYVLGVPDTRTFEWACETHWWPPLRRRYPLAGLDPTQSTCLEPEPAADQPRSTGLVSTEPATAADLRLIRMIHDPPVAPEAVVSSYPAHLHINLLPRLQGHGYGRRLLTTLFDALTTAGASGVHLGVGAGNQRAIGFYRRMGFEIFERSASSLIMTRPLRSTP